jgi:hypothetical protein
MGELYVIWNIADKTVTKKRTSESNSPFAVEVRDFYKVMELIGSAVETTAQELDLTQLFSHSLQ